MGRVMIEDGGTGGENETGAAARSEPRLKAATGGGKESGDEVGEMDVDVLAWPETGGGGSENTMDVSADGADMGKKAAASFVLGVSKGVEIGQAVEE